MKALIFWLHLLFVMNVCKAQDSVKIKKHSLYASVGTYGYIFNRDLVSSRSQDGRYFGYYEINFGQYYSLGGKFNYQLTDRKELSIPILYSNAWLGYLYMNKPHADVYGKIQFNNILLGNVIQYKVFKWFKVNYGINHCINLVNRFDDVEIAKSVHWYDDNGKSRITPYTFAITGGFEIKLYKRFSIGFDYMRGVNTFVSLELEDDPRSRTQQQLRYLGLLFNYKIY